ncbi:MAG: hypothetical protein JWQ27_1895 [Ferruginibacter sp.]|nr:hypothetical protein [Ferruginibacter sp.]
MKKHLLILILGCVALSAKAQPVNDNPCGAINIPVENLGCDPTTTYTYSGATATGQGGCINGTQDPDVWYKFVIPANGQVNFKMAAAAGETQLVIATLYTASSCSGTMIPFQGNTNIVCFFSLPYSGTGINLTPGSQAYIRIYKPNNPTGTSGSFKMCVSNNYQFADEPCNAGFINVDNADPLGQACVPDKVFSWSGATLTPAVPNPTCGVINASNIRDVWFKIRVPASGKLSVQYVDVLGTCAYACPFLAIYTASSCGAGYTQLYCGFTGTELTGLTADAILYCRFYIYSNSVFDYGSVKLCVSQKNTVPVSINSARIGIGIDTPFAKLDVVGSGIFRDKLTIGGDLETRGNFVLQGNIVSKYGDLVMDSFSFGSRLGNRLALYGGLGNNPKYGFGIQGGLLQMFADQPAASIAFGSGNSYNFLERARITNQGADGLTLNGRLVIRNGTTDANNGPGVWLTNPGNSNLLGFMGTQNANNIGFYGGPAAWGFVYNIPTGNIGIGNNTPQNPLSFAPSLGKKISLYPGTNGDVGMGVYGGELRLYNDVPSGKITFGIDNYSTGFTELGKFQQNGAIAMSVFGSIWANGTVYPSDRRYKKNIKPINGALNKVMHLRGVRYEMLADDFAANHFIPGIHMGLIAQDVEAVVPEVVNTGTDGYKAIDYAKLVPLLIEAIKELQQEIEILKRKK